MLRTHNCGQLTKKDIDREVTLCGWIDTRRDHGNLIFIDLRDRWGITQLVFNPEGDKSLHNEAEKLRPEFVIRVSGKVRARPEGTANPKLATGDIEVMVSKLEVLNPSPTPPFELEDEQTISEYLRLKYRFLDLRRSGMLKNLITRYMITKVVRDYFHEADFIEVETPFLTKSTPEGARDFLVPSRLSPGTFYALPQSPQLFKQTLMVSGLDRYFQIVRCFRDEDLRADRQPEHTQIDVEMSFVTEEDIFSVIEVLVFRVIQATKGIKIKTPFPRMCYEEAMNTYGSDKPDLRFGMPLEELSDLFKGTNFKIFAQVLAQGGQVKGINVSGGAKFSLKELEELTKLAQDFGAQGLAWFKVTSNEELESPIKKFFEKNTLGALAKRMVSKSGDLILLVAGKGPSSSISLGALRAHLGRELGMYDKETMVFNWIIDFPLLEWNEEDKRFQALHHPFTSPQEADLELLEKEPLKVKARAYDLVMNGTEVGGGSIRIHKREIQQRLFNVLKIGKKEAEEKFGFLLRALEYGAPPHGGIALGLDRFTALLLGLDSIRDVIAFPKTQKGVCPLTDAPSAVSEKQLKELFITTRT